MREHHRQFLSAQLTATMHNPATPFAVRVHLMADFDQILDQCLDLSGGRYNHNRNGRSRGGAAYLCQGAAIEWKKMSGMTEQERQQARLELMEARANLSLRLNRELQAALVSCILSETIKAKLIELYDELANIQSELESQ